MICPNEKIILVYAIKRGLKKVRLEYRWGGWDLIGIGKGKRGWPLVWDICKELDISWGCGGPDHHQL